MEFEFDKEMDAILRRARAGEGLPLPGSHPDADEIAAFAENAVSDAARARFTAHFADCARCRKILSNVIVFNAEADAETASSAVTVETEKENVPWYRRLFAFPQLAYAMGATVLLFSGFFGYLIIRNMPGAGVSEVSYSTNRTAPAIEPAPADSTVSSANANTAMNSAATTANTAVPAPPSTTTTNTAAVPLSNTSVTTAATPAEKPAVLPQQNAPVAEAQTMATPPAPKPEIRDADDDAKTLTKVAPAVPVDQSNAAGSAVRQQTERRRDDLALKEEQKNEPPPDERLKAKRAERDAPQKRMSRAGETRSVGGKTFNNVGGIWFDEAYNRQRTTTVRRGTEEYQKLDAGLRSIADQLGGTIVIVWSGRAYRIQ